MRYRMTRRLGFLAFSVVGTLLGAQAAEPSRTPAPIWLVRSASEVLVPPPPAKEERADLKATTAQRKAEDVERIAWWSVGGPAYRWNEIAIEELLDGFVTLPLAARHLALLHAAIDDAVATAWHYKLAFKQRRPAQRDPKLAPALPVPPSPSYPRESLKKHLYGHLIFLIFIEVEN
jgi:hypothetical protein